MKKMIIPLLLLVSISIFAVSPVITYPTGAKVYTVNQSIATLTPTNTGDVVAAYATVSTVRKADNSVLPIDGIARTLVMSVNGETLFAPLNNKAKLNTLTMPNTKATLVSSGITTPYGSARHPITGDIYVSDANASVNLILKVNPTTGAVITYAGITGAAATIDGDISVAKFNQPQGLAFDENGNLYVAQYGGGAIRKISADGTTVSTIVTSTAGEPLNNPVNMAYSKGFLYVTELGNQRVSKINVSTGAAEVLAGSGTAGYADGTGAAAQFNDPAGIAVDYITGMIYVGDWNNFRVRKITPTGVVTTVSGGAAAGNNDGIGSAAKHNKPAGVALDGLGYLYVCDAATTYIRKVLVEPYNISPALPAGLTLNAQTGVISGTPTVAAPATDYTITASNADGNGSYVLNITVEESTDHFRSSASGNWEDNTKWETSSNGTTNWMSATVIPTASASSVTITNGHLITINSAAKASTLIIQAGAKLTINKDKSLTANTFTIQSNAENGTGTFVDKGGTVNATNTNVQQYISAGRNWYIGSPVSAATSEVFATTATNPLYYYVEPYGSDANTRWARISNTTELIPTKGYISNMDASVLTSQNNLITFTGGTLNTGNITTGQNGIPALTRTEGQTQAGFNLVANPYPSYLDWAKVERNHIDPTLWYRTKVGSVYKFYTYLPGTGALEEDGISVPVGVTNWIPPMQAFWVKVSSDQSSGSLSFGNNLREHKDISTNLFKSPSAEKSTRQLLRLQVSNGVNDDETVVYFNSKASNKLDSYDAIKMSNANVTIPEIYSKVDTEQLAINGMNSIPFNTELTIGFKTGKADLFTIKATEISNLDTIEKIILKDKIANTEYELGLNVPYSFSSEKTDTADRFGLIFRSNSGISAIQNSDSNLLPIVYRNDNNQIIVNCKSPVLENSKVEIYNAMGQKILSQNLKMTTTVLNKPLTKAVYLMTVINDGKIFTQKLILK